MVPTFPPIGWLRHYFLSRSETFIYTSMSALHAAGVPIRVLAMHRLEPERFPWHDVTVLADSPAGRVESAYYWTTARSPRRDRWARSVRLIHAHLGQTGPYGLAAARRHGLPLVTSYYGHDVTLAHSPARFSVYYLRYALLRARLFREGDRFVVLSNHMRTAMIDQGCPADKLRVVPLGIDLDRFACPPRPPHDGPLRVLMVGREVEKKGFDDGLRACALARDGGVDIHVTVLGTGGPLRPALERLAAELALPVAWPEPAASVPAAMAAADVLLVPSRTAADGDQEGTPTVICEGSAAGLPIVATRHAGIPEQVAHGATGLLAAERDVPALARALVDLAADPDRRESLGRAGRAKMHAEYSLPAHRDALLAVYRELLS